MTPEDQAENQALQALLSHVIPLLPPRSLLDAGRVESAQIVRDAVEQGFAEMTDSDWRGVDPTVREALKTRVSRQLDQQVEDWKHGRRPQPPSSPNDRA